MTRRGWCGLACHMAGIVYMAILGAALTRAGDWPWALGCYATLTLLAVAGAREQERGMRARHAAVQAGTPRPGPPRYGDGTAIDRQVIARTCTCDQWWTSLGTEHDPWCPNNQRSQTT